MEKEKNKGWIKQKGIYILARTLFVRKLLEIGLNYVEINSVILSNRDAVKNLERY